MSNLPKPYAVLFDWDNTLVDTWPIIHRALNMTMRAMGCEEWSFEKVKANTKKSMRESFPDLFGDRWEEAAKHYQQSYRAINLEHLTALPGAEAMLQALKSKGVFVGAVSNKRGETLRTELAHIGWDKYFAIAIGAGDAARDKPSGDPALLALKDYAGPREGHVWFVGDTSVDLGCAAEINATAILYGEHEPSAALHEGLPFHAHVHDHTALTPLLLAAIDAA